MAYSFNLEFGKSAGTNTSELGLVLKSFLGCCLGL